MERSLLYQKISNDRNQVVSEHTDKESFRRLMIILLSLQDYNRRYDNIFLRRIFIGVKTLEQRLRSYDKSIIWMNLSKDWKQGYESCMIQLRTDCMYVILCTCVCICMYFLIRIRYRNTWKKICFFFFFCFTLSTLELS